MQSPAIYQTSLTIPTGATTGARIVIVGTTITGYYADGNIAWQLDVSTNDGLTTFFDLLGSPVGALLTNGLLQLTDSAGNQSQVFTKVPSDIAGDGAFHVTTTNAGLERVGMWLLDGEASGSPGQGAGAWVPSSVGNTLGAMAWQTPGLGSGWDTSVGFHQPVQYRIDAEDNLIIKGSIHATSGTPATTPFTLGNSYIPLFTFSTGILQTNGGNFKGWQQVKVIGLNDAPAGNVSLQGFAYAIGDIINFDICAPLGNLV